MQVVVCIKEVPDASYINIDSASGLLIREGVSCVINPFDAYALEEAIRLKEKYHFKVTAISMGRPAATATLKSAIAMGADEVVLLTDPAFAGSDTLATGMILAEGIKRLNEKDPVIMVICGKQTTDGATSLVGPGIATRLKYSQVTLVDQVQNVDQAAKKIKARRMLEGSFEVIEATLPAVLTVVPQINKPREPSVRMQMAAEKATVPQWNNSVLKLPADSVGLNGSATRVRKVFSQMTPESEILGDGVSDPEGAARLLIDTLIENDIFSI